ncbi:MAG: Arsenate reductase [Alphaproteobacteria bacterium MarineAlpha2_Bin1]|nr:MAG: Arsenate reductase [Alphaproteobacteria bacterium MarineAlpha2_Bin1]|tara:strand:+ start:243 stop:611 length:369 start_codon:yes stop_codon:yes gene_type:complete
MDNIKIYHNPKCSKSREALKLLNNKGLTIDIVLYMVNRLTYNDLKLILNKLNITPNELIRKNEKKYKELISIKNNPTDDDLINFMIDHPNLIQRPIVEIDGKIVVARPPEKILDLIKSNMSP